MEQSPNSDTLTRGIRIAAAAQSLPDESDPDRSRFFFIYKIRIVNEGSERVKLLSRHWIILDAHNRQDEVTGEGVVGEQPELGPGEMFEYQSFCEMRTEWGTMEGTYTFRGASEELFEAKIGRFFLVPSVIPVD